MLQKQPEHRHIAVVRAGIDELATRINVGDVLRVDQLMQCVQGIKGNNHVKTSKLDQLPSARRGVYGPMKAFEEKTRQNLMPVVMGHKVSRYRIDV